MTQRSFYTTFIEESLSPSFFGHIGLKIAILCLTLVAFSHVSAMDVHSVKALQKSVEAYLQEAYRDVDAVKLDITIGNLDPRLQLKQCEQPLVMTLNDPKQNGGNLTVYTRCEDASPWSVYVSAQVSLFRAVWVASHNLARGKIITEADLTQEIMNISSLRQGQINHRESILGQEVQRPIAKGDPFRRAALDSPMVVKRGEIVMIELQAGAISVSSMGTAMSHGRIGDRIKVRNGQSDRVINAEVIAAGKVLSAI